MSQLLKLSALALLSAGVVAVGLGGGCSTPTAVDLKDPSGKKVGEVRCESKEVSFKEVDEEEKSLGVKANTWYTQEKLEKVLSNSKDPELAVLADFVSYSVEQTCK